MPIGLLTLEIYIPEAHSLKDKRQVLRSLKDRLRGKFNVAVAELEGQDSWQRSVVGVVSLANNAGFLEQSLRTVLKYFPAKKVRMKPGGSAGGVNPISWGTYCPGYAKMAGRYHVVLQSADCQGAVFADKWVGTAYQFYGV